MGFLSKVFGSKSKESKLQQVSLQELNEMVEASKNKNTQDFYSKVSGKFASINSLLNNLQAELSELEKRDLEQEGPNKYLRKIVESSKHGFLVRMKALSERFKPPKTQDLEKILSYCLDSNYYFTSEFQSFQKNISYTGILVKDEMKRIAKLVQELSSIFSELVETAQNSSLQELSIISKKTVGISEIQVEIKSLESEKNALEKQVQELGLKKEQSDKVLAQLQDSSDFRQLESAESERQELLNEKEVLKAKAVQLLAPLEKPLKRFEKLVNSKQFIIEKEEARMLSSFLKNPFNALKQDPKAECLKSILSELEKAIASKAVSFKSEKEKSKRLSSLKELQAFDFFSNFFWKLNEIETKQKKIDSLIESAGIAGKINEKKALLETFASKTLELQSSIKSIEKNISEKQNALQSVKSEIEFASEKTLAKKISLNTDLNA